MSNIIRFLEQMGSQAQWRNATPEEIEFALTDAEVEAPMRSAILNKDIAQLQVLLQQSPLIGFQVPGEEEEEEDEGEEAPDEKESKKALYSSSLACPA